MPRSKKTNQFVAGPLPVIKYKNKKYFVDGRMQEVRNVNDFTDVLDVDDDPVWDKLSKESKKVIEFEFHGD